MPSNLTDLANKHRTDKGTEFARGPYGPLGYAEHYERLLGHLRDKPIRLLEIGVAEGSSLRMWREFFTHEDAGIFGLDNRLVSPVAGCMIACGDQSNPKILDVVGRDFGPFDIVIDDGSHQYDDQMASFRGLFCHMAPGGLYCIEDLQADFNQGRTRNFFKAVTGVSSGVQSIRFIADDNIVVIERETAECQSTSTSAPKATSSRKSKPSTRSRSKAAQSQSDPLAGQ